MNEKRKNIWFDSADADRYISTAVEEEEIDLAATHAKLVEIESAIQEATIKHNEFLKELGLSPLPSPDSNSSSE